MIAFSRLAKLIRKASVISLPPSPPVARPRMRAMESYWQASPDARESPPARAASPWDPPACRGQVFKLRQEIGVIQEVVVDRAFEHYDPDILVGLESVDKSLEPSDHFWAHHVDRRVVDRDTPRGGRPPGDADLGGRCKCACSCHSTILLSIC